jgi:hypothetical protein
MILAATILLALCAGSAFAQTPIRIASFNIRYDNTDISIADAEMYWSGMVCVSDPNTCRVTGVLSKLGMVLSFRLTTVHADILTCVFNRRSDRGW